MNAFEFLKLLHDNHCHFQTRERGTGRATYNELRRWMLNGAVIINNVKVKPTDEFIQFFFEIHYLSIKLIYNNIKCSVLLSKNKIQQRRIKILMERSKILSDKLDT